MKRSPNPKAGFTLIELLVVVLVSALLSGLAILYSHVGQNEVSLGIESAKISQLILQAKELSIATYSSTSKTCAYGVHFDYVNQTYSLFAYNSATSTGGSGPLFCPTYASTTAGPLVIADMGEYGGGATWQIKVPRGVVIQSSSPANDVLSDVLFFPPDPITLMGRVGGTFSSSTATSKVYLVTTDGKNAATVSVSPAGQVGY